MAMMRAVANNRKTILEAGDDDQITLALQGVFDLPNICSYYHRIVAGRNLRQLV